MNFKRTSLLFGLVSLISLASPWVEARDLQGRVGLGYNGQFASSQVTNGVPGVSLKYAATRDIALEAIVGVATTSPGNSVFGLKFFKNLFFETNLNFYFLMGGAVLSANSQSGAEFLGGFGAEFFFPGLESLGFSMETGGSFGNIGTGTGFALKTMGMSFLNAGMRFYF
jgi:hypothetical protein